MHSRWQRNCVKKRRNQRQFHLARVNRFSTILIDTFHARKIVMQNTYVGDKSIQQPHQTLFSTAIHEHDRKLVLLMLHIKTYLLFC